MQEDASPTAIVAAIEENLYAFVRSMGTWPPVELHDDAELLWTLSDFPPPFFNTVCRSRLPEAGLDAAIAAAVARCRRRRVAMLWIAGPSCRPPGLASALLHHGFELDEHSAGLARGLGNLPGARPLPAGARLERVASDEAVESWLQTCAQVAEVAEEDYPAFAGLGRQLGYGGPYYHYLAWLAGRPVATLTLFLAAGVAGLYDGATLPEARGQGIFSALMVAALHDAAGLGCKLAVLHASPMALRPSLRLGFRQYCTFDQYVWEPVEI